MMIVSKNSASCWLQQLDFAATPEKVDSRTGVGGLVQLRKFGLTRKSCFRADRLLSIETQKWVTRIEAP